nr:MAG: RNA-dependent RNA polymerase [Riboviria sp.]
MKLENYISTDEQETFINRSNVLVQNIIKDFGGIIPLGPWYTFCDETDWVHKQLAHYRMSKTFCEPGSRPKPADAVNKMLSYDSRGLVSFEPATIKMDDVSRLHLYRTRERLHSALSGFKLEYSGKVPSGETSLSNRGNCSVFAKLKDLKQWQVTADCFDLACKLFYNTLWLKRVAKSHFLKYNKSENYRLYHAYSDQKHCGFAIFREKMLEIVTIVDGSRITTVPKNNDTDRVINTEPLLNMMVQFSISSSIRKILKKEFGLDLSFAQTVHNCKIASTSVATIDLSAASDSNWMSVVNWLYPKRFSKLLMDARSPGGSYNGEFHLFNMLSPMGNGFTFEVMTLTLLACARSFCDTSSVFGDDIIIRTQHAKAYIRLISVLGYKTNESKTFINGYFRESCGGFTHRGKALKTFSFWWADDLIDSVVNINKLIILMGEGVLTDRSCERILEHLKHYTPLLLLSDDCDGSADLGLNIRVPLSVMNIRRMKRKHRYFTKGSPWLKKTMAKTIDAYCHDHRKVDFSIELCKRSEDYISRGRWKQLPKDNLRNVSIAAHYFYSGMCTAPTILNKYEYKARFVML